MRRPAGSCSFQGCGSRCGLAGARETDQKLASRSDSQLSAAPSGRLPESSQQGVGSAWRSGCDPRIRRQGRSPIVTARVASASRSRVRCAVAVDIGVAVPPSTVGSPASSRAMARTGLRMMPTFPSPSLKFRTAGFPQYGFKASMSTEAFHRGNELKPTPGMPSRPRSLLTAFARGPVAPSRGLCVPPGRHFHAPLCERPQPLYPRGPWLRSEVCCLTPSWLTTTPSVSLASTRRFRGRAVYTSRLRCAGAPRRPARPSLLSLLHCPHVPSTIRRWVRDAVPLLYASRYQASSISQRVATHENPSLPAISDGSTISALHRSLYATARVFASPS